MKAEPRCVWAVGAILGEGPVWERDHGELHFVDIEAALVHSYEPATRACRTWTPPAPVTSLVPRERGGFVATLSDGVAFVDLRDKRVERVPDSAPPGESTRYNDGKADRDGHFWFGSMHEPATEPRGRLHRMDADGSIAVLEEGYPITNGPATSADGRTLYHNDTLGRVVEAFDLAADGSLSARRVFARIPEDAGFPDGMTVDAEDHLWLAHYGGSRLTRFAPDGEVERVVPLPVTNVTSCAFGAPDLDVLYVTTARQGLSPEALAAEPLAGALFELVPGVRGRQPDCYAG